MTFSNGLAWMASGKSIPVDLRETDPKSVIEASIMMPIDGARNNHIGGAYAMSTESADSHPEVFSLGLFNNIPSMNLQSSLIYSKTLNGAEHVQRGTLKIGHAWPD